MLIFTAEVFLINWTKLFGHTVCNTYLPWSGSVDVNQVENVKTRLEEVQRIIQPVSSAALIQDRNYHIACSKRLVHILCMRC